MFPRSYLPFIAQKLRENVKKKDPLKDQVYRSQHVYDAMEYLPEKFLQTKKTMQKITAGLAI